MLSSLLPDFLVSDKSETKELAGPSPYLLAGKLTIKVHEAVDLYNTQLIGKQDPLCIVSVGGQSYRTEADVDSGRAAQWDKSFLFTLSGREVVVTLDVQAKGKLSDDPIGRVDIPISCFVFEDCKSVWFPLHTKDRKAAGHVRISSTFINDDKRAEERDSKAREDIAKLQATVNTLRSKATQLNTRLEALDDKSLSAEQKGQMLSQQLSEAESARDALQVKNEELEGEIRGKTERIADLESQLNQAKEQVAALTEQIVSMSKLNTDERDRCVALELALSQAKDTLKEHETRINEVESLNAQLTSNDQSDAAAIAKLTKEANDAKNKVQAEAKKRQAVEGECAALKDQLKQVQNQTHTLNKEVQVKAKDNDQLKKEVADLKGRISKLEKETVSGKVDQAKDKITDVAGSVAGFFRR